MSSTMLAPDRVLLLLSLVPYLREHGPTPVTELAAAFSVKPALLRSLVRFLGTAGVPGETLSYQHEDLFDIDWDALERDDLVSLTRTVAVDDAPRFAPTETAALIAGLHALTGVLSQEDAAIARVTAEKLANALGGEGGTSLSVTADREDPRVAEISRALDSGQRLAFDYRDAAGKASSRTVDPLSLTQGSGTWYLRAYCLERGADRTFRVDQISGLRQVAGGTGRPHTERSSNPTQSGWARDDSEGVEIFARVRTEALPRVQNYAPEILGEPAPGWLSVRIVTWHQAAAIRLVLLAPGELIVEGPSSAVELVSDWTARSLAAYDE